MSGAPASLHHARAPGKRHTGIPGEVSWSVSRCHPCPHEYRFSLPVYRWIHRRRRPGTRSLRAGVLLGAPAAEGTTRGARAGCREPTRCRVEPIRWKQEATPPVHARLSPPLGRALEAGGELGGRPTVAALRLPCDSAASTNPTQRPWLVMSSTRAANHDLRGCRLSRTTMVLT